MFEPLCSFFRLMRPWPLVAASGASGGFAGVLFQIARELSRETGIVVPPDPVIPSGVSGALEIERDLWLGGYHLPSLLVGVLLGLCLGPLLDFLLILRFGLLRAGTRLSRPLARLYRILE